MKYLLFIVCLAFGSLHIQAQVNEGFEELVFQVGYNDEGTIVGGFPRMPIRPLYGSLDDHTFYINGEHSGYTLYLVDNSDDEPDVVYQVVIPAGVNAVVLPATLSGTYELQLHNGGAFYFYAEIILS